MKGDFTRMTFRQPRHYRGVRWQQGRVQNEADDNEQVDIVNHRIETETLDAVGVSGVPAIGGGFAVGVKEGKLVLSAGRMYVGGLLCELDQEVAIDAQPDLPLEGPLAPQPGRYLVYADAWVRHVTAVEDPHLREKALGGPDTCTRMQTVCQAKLLPLKGDAANLDVDTFGLDDVPGTKSTGRMRVGVSEPDAEATPCMLPPQAGYRRLENQLYRIEIHRGGPAGHATFKWSRDNGSVAFAVASRNGRTLELQDLGLDQGHGLDHRHLVELVDDASVLNGEVARLFEVETVDPRTSSITLATDPPAGVATNAQRHPLVRRWDHEAPAGSTDGAIRVVEGQAIALEDGIEIEFEASESEARVYRTGDYWLVPARTVSADVEWPRDAGGNPTFEAPRSSPRAVAALALVERNSTGKWTVDHDCRRRFVAQADHVEVDGVGGDGQLALHEAEGGLVLPQPLRVRVRRGGRAWKGARVKFLVNVGDGALAAAEGYEAVPPSATKSVVVLTDEEGIAEARWTLGSDRPSQRVLAWLEESSVEQGPPVAFGASYIEVLVGRASVELSPHMDWYGTLDWLAKSGAQDVAVTFAAGRYQLEGQQRIRFTSKRSVRLAGMGMGTVIASDESGVVLELLGCEHVTVRDLFVDGRNGQAEDELRGVLDVRGAFNVEVERVSARTATAAVPRLACIAIDGTPTRPGDTGVCEVRVRGCELTPGDEQVGLSIAACNRVVVEDNVVGYAPHEDRTPVGLTLEEKLANDEYAKRVLGYALRDLSPLNEEERVTGWVVINLGGEEKKKVKVKPHPALEPKVRSWLKQQVTTLREREPEAFITKVEAEALERLRLRQLPEESWPVLLRDSILGSYRLPVAHIGIAVTSGELEEVIEVREGRGGAGGGGVNARLVLPEAGGVARAGGPAPARANLVGVGSGAANVLAGADRPTSLSTNGLGSGNDGITPVALAGGPARVRASVWTPTALSYPRRKPAVQVVGNSISHARQGVVVKPKATGGEEEQLKMVEIRGNAVGVDVSVDGIGLDHVGVSVGSVQSVVIGQNRVEVERRAVTATDAMGIKAEGVRVAGMLGYRVIVTENLLVTTQRGDEGVAWDVGVRVEAGEGSAEDGPGRIWRVGAGENAVVGDWT